MSNIRMKKQNETPTEKIDNERKVAVVTGSSSGIGYATALQLARNGYLTFATMRNPEKGSDLIGAAKNEGLPIQVEQLNITDPDSINDFMTRINKTVGRIDVLVNNAGYWLIGALEDLSIREIQDQLDTNMLGSFNAAFSILWENASTSDEVAATILHAISSPEPKLRYPVGSDVAVWLEKKSTMSDEQFQEYMMTSFGSLAPRQT